MSDGSTRTRRGFLGSAAIGTAVTAGALRPAGSEAAGHAAGGAGQAAAARLATSEQTASTLLSLDGGGCGCCIRPLPAFPNKQIVTQWQSGHGWAKSSGGGTVSDDASVPLRGVQSLRIVPATDNTIVDLTRQTARDLSGAHVGLLVKSDLVAPADVDDFSLLLGSGATAFADRSKWTVWRTGIAGDMILATFDLLDGLVAAGAGVNLASVQDFRVVASAKSPLPSPAPNCWFGELFTFDRPAKGTVVLWYDDSTDDHFTRVKPKLDEHDLNATFGVIADAVGTAGYITEAQLLQLRDQGYDLQPHAGTLTAHATTYTGMTAADALADAQTAIDYLCARGCRDVEWVVYPGGEHDASVIAALKPVARGGRTTLWDVGSSGKRYETFPCGDPFRMTAFTVHNDTRTSAIQALVDQAIRDRSVLNLCFHRIKDAGPLSTLEYLTADHATVVDYIAGRVGAGTLEVKPISRLYA